MLCPPQKKINKHPGVPEYCLWEKFMETGSAADMHVILYQTSQSHCRNTLQPRKARPIWERGWDPWAMGI